MSSSILFRRAHALLVAISFGVFSLAALAEELPRARPDRVGLSSERIAVLDNAMQAEIDAGNKAGIVVLIAREGRIAHLESFGYANLETGEAMEVDTLVRMYSMTKPIASVALLTLFEQGKFQLNDPLEMYIPAMADLKVFAGVDANGEMLLEAPERKPTILDAFRHTAGFTYGNSGTEVDAISQSLGIGYGNSDSLAQLVTEQLPQIPLLYHPGEQWMYSFAHDVQAYLVEYFSGMPFEDYLQQTILDPLQMEDTVWGVPEEYVDRYSANYATDPDGGLQLVEYQDGTNPQGEQENYQRYTNVPFGGSGLSSTANDYARFALMLVNGGELDGIRILSPVTVDLMTSNHLAGATSSGLLPGAGYGLGVHVIVDVAESANLGSEGMFGWAGAATTWVWMDPEADMVSIFLTQYMPTDFNIKERWQTLTYQTLVEQD